MLLRPFSETLADDGAVVEAYRLPSPPSVHSQPRGSSMIRATLGAIGLGLAALCMAVEPAAPTAPTSVAALAAVQIDIAALLNARVVTTAADGKALLAPDSLEVGNGARL